MPEQIFVHVKTAVRNDKIKREKRYGRDVIVVQSATMPDDIVMNGIKYPGAEIEKSYNTLDQTPAPLGHPETPEGDFVSARTPLGMALGYIGAHNENVRRENGRVYLDKVIDVARANDTEGGRRVLEAIDKGEPIHTSTGLFAYILESDDGGSAYDIEFDHDAILLDEEGAATPAHGVGMMVNRKGKKLAVTNASLDDIEEDFNRQVEWAVDDMIRAAERREDRIEKRGILDRIKTAIFGAIAGERETETKTDEVLKMTEVTKEQFEELSAKVNALAEVDVKAVVAEAVAPLIEAANAAKEAASNAEAAQKAALVEKIVKANKLTQETAEALPLDALKELANAAIGKAAPIAPGFDADDKAKGEFTNDWEAA